MPRPCGHVQLMMMLLQQTIASFCCRSQCILFCYQQGCQASQQGEASSHILPTLHLPMCSQEGIGYHYVDLVAGCALQDSSRGYINHKQ